MYADLFVFLSIKLRKVLAENFLSGIALDPRCTGIPVDHSTAWIEHKNRIVGNAFDQNPEAALPFLKPGHTGRELRGAFLGALLKRPIQVLQFGFRLLPGFYFANARLEEPRIIDRDCRLRRYSDQNAFCAFSEHSRLGVPEKQASQDLAPS